MNPDPVLTRVRGVHPPAGPGAAPRILLYALASALFALRAWHGTRFLPFGDEQGHILGAQAIHAGEILYRDYIDAHGPLIFAATQLCLLLSGFADLQSARAVPIALALAAALALLLSPGQLSPGRRAAAPLWLGLVAPLWLGLIATVWIVQGLYLDSYFPVGGALLVIQLALHAAPAADRLPTGPAPAALAGLAAALACWTAYSFVPTVLLFAFAGRNARPAAFLAGFAAGGLAGLAWVLAFADPIGLVVFHVIANQLDYAPYVRFTPANFLASLVPSLAPARIVQTLAVLSLLAAAVLAAALPGRGAPRPASRLPILLGVLALDARGLAMFQDGAFLMAAFATLALALDRPPIPPAATALAGLVLVALFELAARHAIASPSGLDRAGLVHAGFVSLGPTDDPVSREVRALTAPADRLLALPYDPGFFTDAGRLPIPKYHAYLPWEADYARHPWFGRTRDLCADLPRERPKLIRFERWRVWDRYDPAEYMSCVVAILARDYVRVGDTDLWLRRALPKP